MSYIFGFSTSIGCSRAMNGHTDTEEGRVQARYNRYRVMWTFFLMSSPYPPYLPTACQVIGAYTIIRKLTRTLQRQ
jgi:hypothetical protein